MKIGYRYVQFCAVRVFKREKLACHAANVHGFKAEVASDSVIDVYHRCAVTEFREASYDGFPGISCAPSAAILTDALAYECGLRNECEGVAIREGQCAPGFHGADREADLDVVGEEVREIVHQVRLQPCMLERLEEDFASTGRFRQKQYSPGRGRTGFVAGDPARDPGRGRVGAHIEGNGREGGNVELEDRRAAAGLIIPKTNLGEAAQAGEELVHGQEEIVRGQDGALRIPAQVLVAFGDFVAEQPGVTACITAEHRTALLRQIVGKRGEMAEEQRQVVLDARRYAARTDILVNRAAARVDVEARVPSILEGADRILVEGKFLRREQADRVDGVDGALRLGIECAQRIDLVVEEVDAIGRRRPHREDVHERAAHRVFAMLEHRVDAAIAGGFEGLALALQVEARTDIENEGSPCKPVGRRHTMHQRRDRHDKYGTSEVWQALQRFDALRDDVLMWREAVVGKGFPVGEVQDLRVVLCAQEEVDFRFEASRGARVSGDHEEHAVVCASGLRESKGICAGTEIGPGDSIGSRVWQRWGKGRSGRAHRGVVDYRAARRVALSESVNRAQLRAVTRAPEIESESDRDCTRHVRRRIDR